MTFDVLEYGLGLAAIVWWGFVSWYTLRSKWWKNPYGRNLAGVGIDIAAMWTLAWSLVTFGWQYWMIWAWMAVAVHNIYMGAKRTYYAEMAQRESRVSETEIIERLVTELSWRTGMPERLVWRMVEQMRSTVLD